MNTIKLINLFILALVCQVVVAQNNGIVKSFNLRMDKSVEKVTDNANVEKTLKRQLKIPENYEFKRQIIKGTKEKTSEVCDLGYLHERYAQYYKGIKIENSDIRVRYLNGVFVSANGDYIDAPNIDVSIVITPEDAIKKAIEHIGAEKYRWEDEDENNYLKKITNNEKNSFYPNPEIVICKNYIDLQDTTFHIAYKIDIYAQEPLSSDYVYVDAKNGNILAVNSMIRNYINTTGTADTRYSGTRTISTAYDTNTNLYVLRDYTRGKGIETFNMKSSGDVSLMTDFTDDDNYWSKAEFHNANKDDAGLEAHWGAMITWDYFYNVHGRYSFDNNGAKIQCFVNSLAGLADAVWGIVGDIGIMDFGSGNATFDTYVCLSLVGHEFGHGVSQYTANFYYWNHWGNLESMAICESLSDIWGACVSNYANDSFPELNKNIWLHRSDLGTNVRSFINPNLSTPPQPDTYGGGAYWSGSNGGAHHNAGIMSHWFYILCEGKSGTNGIGNAYNVTGIGISKAEKIAYRALAVYMTGHTTFADARTHTIQAAIDLYGHCSPEVIGVANAWHAVGVGNAITSYSAAICQGKTYSDSNFTGLTQAGFYCDTLQNISGRDSIICFTLTEYPSVPITNYSASFCYGKTYSDANFTNLTQADIYYDTLQNINGCDSIIELTLTVNSVFFTQINDSIGAGDSYNFNGKLLTTSGIYCDTLQTMHNCDSILELTLTVASVSIVGAYRIHPIQIFPNPTDGKLRIEMQNAESNKQQAEIYDIYGRKLSAFCLLPSATEIDISHLSNGLYFLKINNKTVKVIKK